MSGFPRGCSRVLARKSLLTVRVGSQHFMLVLCVITSETRQTNSLELAIILGNRSPHSRFDSLWVGMLDALPCPQNHPFSPHIPLITELPVITSDFDETNCAVLCANRDAVRRLSRCATTDWRNPGRSMAVRVTVSSIRSFSALGHLIRVE